MKAQKLTTDSDKQQEKILEGIIGNASINKISLVQLESMVASKYHTQELEARGRLIKDAKPLYGVQRQEREAKATGRDTQCPKGLALQIVFQIVFLMFTPKYARQPRDFFSPLRCGLRFCWLSESPPPPPEYEYICMYIYIYICHN